MPEAAAAPEVLGLRAFADRIGKRPSYVTELKAANRLVLTPDGRRVLVAESLALIADTSNPAKAGVAARHAAARGQGGAAAPVTERQADAGADSGGDLAPVRYDDPLSIRRAKAQAEREEALARKALREEQLELGQLLKREDVEAAIAAAATTLRTGLQNLPHALAPELAAAATEERCQVLLANGIEHALDEMSRRFSQIGRAT